MMSNIFNPLYRLVHLKVLLLLFTFSTTFLYSQTCPQSVEVVVEGERCAGNGDGKAKVVINGQGGSGTAPLSCESPLTAQESCTSGCTRTYSSNSGELVITSGERVCLSSPDFRGGIQASGGTLVVCGSMTPSYFNLNSSNPSFTLVVLGSATLQSLNLFGNSTVKNYGTITVGGSIGFNGELINEGTLNVSGDVSVNAPYGKITNRGTLQVGTNLNVYNTLYNGGVITVAGTLNNNSGGGIENNCTLTVGGDFNNNVTTVNRGKIKVTGTGRMNGASRYEGYGGSLLETTSMTVDGIVMGKSTSCAAIKVSGNTIINSSASFSGKIDYCDASGIETNTGQWTAPAVHDCSCAQGTVNATYTWSAPLTGSTATQSNLTPGTYSVSVAIAGCSTVTKNFTITAATALSGTVTSTGLTASVAVSGGVAPYSYVWTGNSATSSSAAYGAAGDYSVVITDSKGCQLTKTFTLTAPSGGGSGSCDITVQTTPVSCAGGNDGKASVYLNGALLSDGQGSGGLTAGCSAQQTSSVSCSAGCTQTITDNTQAVNMSSGQVCLTATNYTGGWNISGAGTLVVCGKATPQYANFNTNGGAFTLVVTAGSELTMSYLNLPQGSILKNYGKITFTGSIAFQGRVENYGEMSSQGDFNNNNPVGTFYNYGKLTVNGNLNNNYRGYNYGILTISGNLHNNGGGELTNGCTLVVGNELINNNKVYNQGSITVAHWTRLNGGSVWEQGSGKLLKTGHMTLDGTLRGTGSSCSAVKVAGQTIINGSGRVEGPGPLSLCDATGIETNTGTVVSPAVIGCSCLLQTIDWQSPLVGGANPYQGLAAGTYTVKVEVAGCGVVSKTFTITEPAAITATVSISAKTASVAASGGTGTLQYTWSDGSTGTSASHTFVNNGSYSVTITDSKNCSKTLPFDIPAGGSTQQPPCGKISVEYTTAGMVQIGCECSPAPTVCSIVDSTRSGDPLIGNLIPRPKQDSVVVVRSRGEEYLIILSGSNPPATTSLQVTASVTGESYEDRKDGSIQLTISGGSGDYSIINSETTQTGSSTWIGNLTAGPVEIEVYDNVTGLTYKQTITIPLTNPLPDYQLQVLSTNSNNQVTSIKVVDAQGNPPASNVGLSWSIGGNTPTVNVPSWAYNTGYISVTLQGSNGSFTKTLTYPLVANCSSPSTLTTTSTAVSCKGSKNGSASVVSGAPSGATLVWSGTPYQQSGSSVSNLGAGNYQVQAYVNVSGQVCLAGSATVTISEPGKLAISLNRTGRGNFTAQATGGTAPYSYQWSNGVTTAVVNITQGGYYQVQVTDSKGCVAQRQVYVPAGVCSGKVNVDITPINCQSPTSGAIQASSTVSGASYYWSAGPGVLTGNPYSNQQSNLTAGSYVVAVKGWPNNQSCLSRTGAVLRTPKPVSISHRQSGNRVDILVTGGRPNYVITWLDNNQVRDFRTDLVAGQSYQVKVKDGRGCEQTYSFTFDPCSVNALSGSVKMDGGTATAQVEGGVGPYSYLWSIVTSGSNNSIAANPTLATQTNLNGQYKVEIKDSRGCKVEITVSGPNCGLNAVNIQPTAPSCRTKCDGKAVLTGWSTTLASQVFVSWDGTGSGGELVNACSGPHVVQLKTQAGCYVEKSFSVPFSTTLCEDKQATTPQQCAGFTASVQNTTQELIKVCAEEVVNLRVLAQGGRAPYQYTWTVKYATGNTTEQQIKSDKINFDNATPGEYTLKITDVRGCSTTTSKVIVQGAASGLSGRVSVEKSCYGVLDKIRVEGFGGSGNLQAGILSNGHVSWWVSVPAGGALLEVPAGGAYTVRLKDELGCQRDLRISVPQAATISNRTLPQGTITSQMNPLPQGRSSVLYALPLNNYRITWDASTKNGLLPTEEFNANRADQRIARGGTYTVYYSKAGCDTLKAQYVLRDTLQAKVQSPLCDGYIPVEITPPSPDSLCKSYKVAAARALGAYRYQQYVYSQKQQIREGYIAAVLGTAEEHLTIKFNDKEEHYTLYYYDQSGNLVRTVPPSGVKVLSEEQTQKAIAQMVNGKKEIITEHSYTTTYGYNSLNQLVYQSMPDHDNMDLWQSGATNLNLPAGSTITSVGYGSSNNGLLLSGTQSGIAQLYKTTNAGTSFTQVSDYGLGKITCFSRVAGLASLVYAAGEAGTLIKSTSSGESWVLNPLPSGEDIVHIATVAPPATTPTASNTIVLVSTKSGKQYLSADGGASWSERLGLYQSLSGATLQDISSYNTSSGGSSSIQYWAVSSTGKVYRSSDGGQSWNEQSIITPTMNGITTTASGALLGVGPKGTVYEYNTGSSTTQVSINRTNLGVELQGMVYVVSDGYYGWSTTGSVYYAASNSSSAPSWTQMSGLSGVTRIEKTGGIAVAYTASGAAALMNGVASTSLSNVVKVRAFGINYAAINSSGQIGAININNGSLTAYTLSGLPAGTVIQDIIYVSSSFMVLTTTGDLYDGGIVSGSTITFPVESPATEASPRLSGVSALYEDEQGVNYVRTTSGALQQLQGVGNTATQTTIAQLPSTAGTTAQSVVIHNNTVYILDNNTLKKSTSSTTWSNAYSITPAGLKTVSATGAGTYVAGANGEIYYSVAAPSSNTSLSYVPTVQYTATFMDVAQQSSGSTTTKVVLTSASKAYTYSPSTTTLTEETTTYTNARQVSVEQTAGTYAIASDNTPATGEVTYSVDNSSDYSLAGGAQGKIWKTTTGNNYQPTTLQVQTLNSVAYLTNSQVIAVGKQGTILYSTTGGASWKAAYSTTTQELSQVSGSGQKAVAISKTGAVIYTSNGGTTWQASSTTFNTTTGLPYSVKQTGTTTLLTAGTKLYQSTNGGQSFSQLTISPSPTANLKGVHLDEDGYGYVVGEQGQAYKLIPAATPGTYTITKIATDSDTKKDKGTGIPTGANLETVQFSDRLTGYITGKDAQGQGMVVKTVDGGLHWTTKESGSGTTIPQLALSGDAQQGTIINSSGAVASLNDQSEQISSRFWYDELGRLILSQNARQFTCTDCPTLQQQQGAKAYSYTLYDEIGRIKEVGELLSTIEPTIYKNRSQIKYSDHTTYVTSTTSYRHQVTTTKYDRTDRGYQNFTATYLRNRVAYTTYQQTPSSQVQESHYSYDVHGNVKSMLQVIRGDGEELTKKIDYEYDLVSGKVNKVIYQKDNSDQFIHRYEYDGDNRIIQVATSTDDIVYTQEATYQYYAHGPLARINYGELNVETQDFAYTIQGWIKQVQGQVFAYALGYNNTDYSPIGAATLVATPIQTDKSLYNGNIATMTSRSKAIANNTDWTQQFTYDQLNRIKTSTTAGGNSYATSYSYDANGNILNLTRKNDQGNNIDNLTYNYENKAAGYQRNTNRLRSVDDAVATTSTTDDIEDQQEDNYRYDATGNLIYDRSEEIERIEWTVSGKVLKVIRTTTSSKPNLEFTYDASGNRIAKKVIQPNGNYSTTFYVRDASGNVMAVYKTSGTTNLSLEEQHIYGSSRLGIFKKDKTRKSTTRALGERRYELTDHLGNVRVVLSDYKKAESIVVSATDYYPFGMVARTYTSPEEYRYGFNGKERDNENFEGAYDFGARILDVRLGRWLAVDPMYAKYVAESPFSQVRCNPLIYVDVNGKDWFYYQAQGSNAADWHWHQGTEIQIQTSTNASGQAEYTTVTGHAAVVVINGSRNEQQGAGSTINGTGAVTATIKVYGPDGQNDVEEYTGYTMTSNANTRTPIDEGVYTVKRRASSGSGALPKHYQLFQNGSDQIRTMDGVTNQNAPTQLTADGEGYKDGIFIHRSNNNGYMGGTVSTGCLLIDPNDWPSFDDQLDALGNSLDGAANSRSFTLVLNRTGSDHNPVLPYVIENKIGNLTGTLTEQLFPTQPTSNQQQSEPIDNSGNQNAIEVPASKLPK